MASKIGIITGIQLEDSLVRKGFKLAGYSNVLTACAAGTAEGAQRAAQALINQGATLLISFGVCGGLSPYVKAGDLILAGSVSMNGEIIDLKSAWHQAALAQNPDARSGIMLSVAKPISTPEAKYAAYKNTEAVAVDVESFAVAQIAKDNGLACLIIRAVLDTAKQSLPDSALSGVDETGKTQIWPVIKSLLKRPQDLPALLDLARDSGRAQDTLKSVIKKGAPDFWAP